MSNPNTNMPFPTLPVDDIAIFDSSSKRIILNPSWQSFFDQIVLFMNKRMSQQGLQIPILSQETITNLETSADASHKNDPNLIAGKLVYNSDTNKGMIGEVGVSTWTFKTITTT